MMLIELRIVIVFIGLFGCGKLMFLCILNWMYEVILGGWVEGIVVFNGCDFYVCEIDLVVVWCMVGMVF